MPWRKTLCRRLSEPAAQLVMLLSQREADLLEEIRFRVNRPAELVIAGKSVVRDCAMGEEQMQELVAALSGYALYAVEAQMAQGYIPLPGGHRVGVCGRICAGNDGTLRMSGVTSACLRISRPIEGASRAIRRFLCSSQGVPSSVLILGPPGCGKTTVLRDITTYLSDGCALHVAVADEREELNASAPGLRVDVLGGLPKAQAMMQLLRVMAPQVLVTDEIGREEDAQAILETARCGVALVATAHAARLEDLLCRPMLRRLVQARAFDWYVQLGWHGACLRVWDADCTEQRIGEAQNELGCSGDGDDWRERSRVPGS